MWLSEVVYAVGIHFCMGLSLASLLAGGQPQDTVTEARTELRPGSSTSTR